MSIIVGFNLGTYLLIGADTRVSYYPDGHFLYRDDEEKIQATELGLISGQLRASSLVILTRA